MLPLVEQAVHCRLHRPLVSNKANHSVHSQHVISYHVRATGKMTYGSEALQAEAPYLVLLAEGESDLNTFTGEFEAYWCFFRFDQVSSLGGREVNVALAGASHHGSHQRLLSTRAAATTLLHFQELLECSRRPDPASRLRSSGKLLELLAIWAEPSKTDLGTTSLVQIYRELIEKHWSRSDLSLGALAQEMGYSINHLGTLFKKELGLSPVEYRNRLRLSRAREMLLSGSQSIAAIAAEVGFPDANYFSRIFRVTFGISPRRFVHEHHLNIL